MDIVQGRASSSGLVEKISHTCQCENFISNCGCHCISVLPCECGDKGQDVFRCRRPLLKLRFFHIFHLIKPFLWWKLHRVAKKRSVLRWPFLISPANLMVGILHTCKDLQADTSVSYSAVLCASNAPLVHCKSANHIRTTINNIFQDGETIKIVWTNLSPRLSCDAFLVNNVWVGPMISQKFQELTMEGLATGYTYLHKMDCGDLSPSSLYFGK